MADPEDQHHVLLDGVNHPVFPDAISPETPELAAQGFTLMWVLR